MKGRGLIILTAAVTLVVGYAFYDVFSEKKTEEKKEIESRVFQIEADQISEFSIQGKERLALKKTQQGWQIEHPLSELADSESVEEFIKGVALEKYSQIIKQGEDIQWKDYGLDAPLGQISLRANSGQTYEIQISSTKNYQGDAYLRINKENKVLLASSTWYIKLEKKPIDFRNKKIFKEKISDILSLKFNSSKERFSISKKENQWIVSEKLNLKLDQNKVRNFISSLESTQATDIIEKKNLSLGREDFKLSIDLNQQKWTGSFYKIKNGDSYFASEGAYAYKLNLADYATLTKLDVESLRDRREPFSFVKSEAKSIELETAAKKTILKLKNENWELETGNESFQVDQVKVKSLLSKLESLQVENFLDSKNFKPNKNVSLKTQDGEVLFTLMIGESKKEKEKTVFLAKTNLYPDVFTLSEDSINNLSIDEIVAKKLAEKPSESD